MVKQPYFVIFVWSTTSTLDKKPPNFLNFDVTWVPDASYAGDMSKRTDSRARRAALVVTVATVGLWGSFGAAVHADDEPADQPPTETGETGGAIVAVGPPPVPPTTVVVAVGPPPVPPAPPVVVAVGPPPVPPAPPVSVPSVPPQARADDPPGATPHALAAAPRPEVVTERLTELFEDVFARLEAVRILIDSRL